MNELHTALVGYADWLGYGHGERAEAWLARLDINRSELAYFCAQSCPDGHAYQAQASPLAPAAGSLSLSDTPGSSLPADASAALMRARAAAQCRAFTYLADEIAPDAAARGYLAGVPVAIKDLMAVQGMPLTGGSASQDPMPALHDAEAVARLKRQGAVVIGMLNLHELAFGDTSDNPHFGRVVNPVAPGQVPGGSSGGSAAAIAAGVVRATLGTDTGGSIRVPAACCGIVGFKPGYDVVPRSGVMDLAPSLDHVGPMGLRVGDCALLFAALLDLPAMPQWANADMCGIKVARLSGYFSEPLDPEVRRALDAACAALAGDGAHLLALPVDGVESAASIQFITMCTEAAAVHAQRLQQRGGLLGEDVRVRLEIAHFMPGHWYVKAQRMRQRLAAGFEALFEHADILVCPTMRAPAPLVGATQVDVDGRLYPRHTAVSQLTMPFNLTGLPAISVPWGTSSAGVPIGLQLVGRRGADWQVLAAAQRLEALAPRRAERLSMLER